MSWQQTFLFASEPCAAAATATAPAKRSRKAGKSVAAKQAVAKPLAASITASITASVTAADCASPNKAASPIQPTSPEFPASPNQLISPADTPADPLARVDQLRQLVRRMEGRGTTIDEPEPIVFSAGGPTLDALLPHGGLRPGTLVEWVCDARRSGANLLAMIAAASVLGHESSANRPLVVVDGLGEAIGKTLGSGANSTSESFYPPAAISLGIAAESMVIIRKQRGHTRGDLIWAIDQSLRSGAVAAVYAEIGDWLDPADARRLQLAAEAGGAVGLFVRPTGLPSAANRSTSTRSAATRSAANRSSANPSASTRSAATRASFADVRWIVSPLPGHGGRRLRVELDRCRGGVIGASRVIEIGVAADRLTGYGAASGDSRLGPTVVIREVKHQEVAERNAGGSSDAATKVAGDLVGRLADPAAKALAPERRQPAVRSDNRRHAG